MVRIHEHLYQFGDLAQIEMGGYIQNLVSDLCQTYGAYDLIPRVKADVKLDISKAIPCSLLINELVSNALKYAFPEGRDRDREDEICVEMGLQGDEYVLVVADNGVGLPVDLDPEGPKTLGLRLVGLLIRQLKGILNVDRSRDEGAAFEVTFGG